MNYISVCELTMLLKHVVEVPLETEDLLLVVGGSYLRTETENR